MAYLSSNISLFEKYSWHFDVQSVYDRCDGNICKWSELFSGVMSEKECHEFLCPKSLWLGTTVYFETT